MAMRLRIFLRTHTSTNQPQTSFIKAKTEKGAKSIYPKKRTVLILAMLSTIIVASVTITYYSLTRRPLVAKVGIFYYSWYDLSSEVSWDTKKIIDQPILGRYNSSDPAVVRQHLAWIEDLGVDFVVLSWWGFYDDYGQFTDNSIKQLLNIAKESNSSLKFVVMVEPFNKGNVPYDYPEIYNHVYNDFVLPYSSLYYLDDEPLICFFNDPTLTESGTVPQDNRFKIILVGQENYVQWIYTDLNYYSKPIRNPYTNQISVTPRYDDSHVEGRQPCIVDDTLENGIYGKEWENAISLLKEGKIDVITITSWNEYPERTAIEPHHDATAFDTDPWFLYYKTRDYIQDIRLLAK